MTEEERIAILPPYERAKLALQKLDQSDYLNRDDLKSYYSDLTMIMRQYIDEKVYDHALESTTQELIDRLQLLKDGNQIDLDPKTIENLEVILKRADLVKFAKAQPPVEAHDRLMEYAESFVINTKLEVQVQDQVQNSLTQNSTIH